MNLAEYYAEVENVWKLIEERIEDLELDLDCHVIGSVFTVETPSKQQVIINRQEPKLELWLASTAGASHYYFKDGQWLNTANQKSFWEYCDEAFVAIGQEKIFSDLY